MILKRVLEKTKTVPDVNSHLEKEQQPVQAHQKYNGLKHGLYFQSGNYFDVANIYFFTKFSVFTIRK